MSETASVWVIDWKNTRNMYIEHGNPGQNGLGQFGGYSNTLSEEEVRSNFSKNYPKLDIVSCTLRKP